MVFSTIFVIGALGIVFCSWGLLKWYIILLAIAIVAEAISAVVKSSNIEDTIQELEERINGGADRNQQTTEQIEADIISRRMIPVKIDNKTGTYVVELEAVVKSLDDYYSKLPIIPKNDKS